MPLLGSGTRPSQQLPGPQPRWLALLTSSSRIGVGACGGGGGHIQWPKVMTSNRSLHILPNPRPDDPHSPGLGGIREPNETAAMEPLLGSTDRPLGWHPRSKMLPLAQPAHPGRVQGVASEGGQGAAEGAHASLLNKASVGGRQRTRRGVPTRSCWSPCHAEHKPSLGLCPDRQRPQMSLCPTPSTQGKSNCICVPQLIADSGNKVVLFFLHQKWALRK